MITVDVPVTPSATVTPGEPLEGPHGLMAIPDIPSGTNVPRNAPGRTQGEARAMAGSLSPHWSPEIQRWGYLIVEGATKHGVDPDLVAAIIHVESRGNPNAISHSGAVGLMQVMAREYGYTSRPPRAELLDPATNIEWGLRILGDGLAFFGGDVALALGEYYDGRANAMARTQRTVGYAALVLRHYEAAKGER